jgi:hypothetical protein
MLKKVVRARPQQAKRGGVLFLYVEPLRDARTMPGEKARLGALGRAGEKSRLFQHHVREGIRLHV